MTICICKNINDKQLQQLLTQTTKISELKEICGIGTKCGKCMEYLSTLKIQSNE